VLVNNEADKTLWHSSFQCPYHIFTLFQFLCSF